MIAIEQLTAIADTLRTQGVSDETVSQLRASYSPMHFTYCMDDDLPNNSPVLTDPQFNLYLVDGREHCLCLTNDSEVATGIVVAEVIPE